MAEDRIAMYVELHKGRWTAWVETLDVVEHLGTFDSAYEAVCEVEEYARGLRDTMCLNAGRWEDGHDSGNPETA